MQAKICLCFPLDEVFAFFLCQISVDSSDHHMKAITLVVFPVFYTNHCVKLLQNFIQGLRFIVSKSIYGSQILVSCFSFVESFCLYFLLPQSLNYYVVTLSSPVHHFVQLCFSRFTGCLLSADEILACVLLVLKSTRIT